MERTAAEELVTRQHYGPSPVLMHASHIVAVVSADDPEAVFELLYALPAKCGAAFMIIRHADSSREKLLAEALAKRTTLSVMLAADGMAVEQDHVYVIPAGATLTMSGRRIRVAPNSGALHHPGDILCTSLAQERGDSAVGVVLSGGGSDGALGMQAIKRAGGITLAQYPGSARFPSMPISAIDTGCVRFVLRPYELAHELARLCGYAAAAAGPRGSDERIMKSRSRVVP